MSRSTSTAATIPSASPVKRDEETLLAVELLDRILRDVAKGETYASVSEQLHERVTELRRPVPELQDGESKELKKPPFLLHRRLWLTQLQGILRNWKEHYLEKDADVWLLAEWLAARLLLEIGGNWEPETEDLRQALFAHWCQVMLPALRLWEQGYRAASGGRLYDFEDAV